MKDHLELTQEEHKKRHKQLHQSLDMLVADYIRENNYVILSAVSVNKLLSWAELQADRTTVNQTPLLTKEQHLFIHKGLEENILELSCDWLSFNKAVMEKEKIDLLLSKTIMDLAMWSYAQTLDPDEVCNLIN